jgi:hypothetical protein
MTTKFMSATLLATAAVFGLASGTAFAGNDRVPDAGGYVYPNFWADPSAQQQLSARTAQKPDGASIGTYITHTQRSTGTYLFPPNPWQ